MLYYKIELADTAGVYLLIWIICVFLTLGVAYATSAIAVYVPDLAQIAPVGLNIIFWLTPLLYPATLVEQGGSIWVRTLIMDYNPFSYLVELSRHAVFGSDQVTWSALVALGVFSVVTLVAGLLVFRKLKPGFADVI
jgi:ABC-type polysaccharide/polyol phosphate export permease